MSNAQPITLLVCALGGEGGGVLTEWIVATAHRAGYAAQSTSIPGVAQRTGATTYYVEVFPIPMAELNGKRPVFSLNPLPGALDALVSSELMETARQVGNAMTTHKRTRVITSSARALTTMERMQLGDGRVDSETLVRTIRANSREHHIFDMGSVAREAGTIVSAVMLGAVAGSGLFPFRREDFEAIVGDDAISGAASLRGFAKGFDVVCAPQKQAAMVAALLVTDAPVDSIAPTLPPAVVAAFPKPVHAMLALGHARMLEYQGVAYAALYVERLHRVLASERVADPAHAQKFASTTEMARWLALWMAFDDIVRVAELKSRATRAQRVAAEVKARPDDLLRIYDHFKPGVSEFAALLPAGIAQKLVTWDRTRVMAGKLPWALPLKLATHSITGMLALRALASLRWLRVRGSRYAIEQAMIELWLAAVVDGTRRSWQLGHEIAGCGRLIKGYGSTNERGKENLLHVIEHLAHGADATAAIDAVAAAREAALADDAGKAFDVTLQKHGAPARAVKAQPIRFVRKKQLSC